MSPTSKPQEIDDSAPQEELAPGLYWAVRESFVDYVMTSPDGELFGDDGVESDGQGLFRFPHQLSTRASHGAGWVIEFAGSLRFIAHFGALDVSLSGIRVELNDAHTGTLSIADSKGTHYDIAILQPAAPVPVENWLVWPPIAAALTHFGSELLGGVYGEGAALDPLRIVISADIQSSSK